MNNPSSRGQGALEYLLLIGGSVVVAVIVIFIVMGLAPSAGNQAQTGLEAYREVTGIKVTGSPTVVGGSQHLTGPVEFNAYPSKGSGNYLCDWQFGDGTSALGALCNISHDYLLAGTYTASVTVKDTSTGDVSLPKTLTVEIAQVGAGISFSPLSPVDLDLLNATGGTGSITVSCTNKQPTGATCSWSVATSPAELQGAFSGGGQTAAGSPVIYNIDMATPGTYNFTLTVGSSLGSYTTTSSITATMKITGNITMSVPLTPSGYSVGEVITFNANPIKGSGNYRCDWSFGDASDIYNDICQRDHAYGAPETYTVTVSIIDMDTGSISSPKTATVEIKPPTQAVITAPASVNLATATSITLSCAGSTVKDPPAICTWSVTPSTATLSATTGDSVTLITTTIDFYTVNLTVTDLYAAASASQEVEAYFLETFDSAAALNNLPNRYGTGTWTVANWGAPYGSVLQLDKSDAPWTRAISNIEAAQPYAVSMDFRMQNALYYGLISSQAAVTAENAYLLYGPTGTVVFLYEWAGDTTLIKGNLSPLSISTATWYNAKFMRTQNNTLKAFINTNAVCGNNCQTPPGGNCASAPIETDVCEFTDSTPKSGKRFGVGVYNATVPSTIYFDNLEVRKCRASDCSDR